MEHSKVKVYCRVRPGTAQEKVYCSRYCVSFPSVTKLRVFDSLLQSSFMDREDSLKSPMNRSTFNDELLSLPGYNFDFNRVFPPQCTQENLYEEIGKPIVHSVLQGYNHCLFAYGETAGGKTYTMLGTRQNQSMAQPRSNSKNEDELVDFEIKLGVVEIYLDTIRDLLIESNPIDILNESCKLKLRDSRGGSGVHVQGIHWRCINHTEDIFRFITLAEKNRVSARTVMNDRSSRSHAIYMFEVLQMYDSYEVWSKLYLVDLAGSEKVDKTNAKGVRLAEAKSINKSLSSLSSVINKLSKKKTSTTPLYIPYRDSKLTRILQEGLGGNSKTSFLLCCSPSGYNFEETLSTARFGRRLCKVANPVRRNAKPRKGLTSSSRHSNCENTNFMSTDATHLEARLHLAENEIRILKKLLGKSPDKVKTSMIQHMDKANQCESSPHSQEDLASAFLQNLEPVSLEGTVSEARYLNETTDVLVKENETSDVHSLRPIRRTSQLYLPMDLPRKYADVKRRLLVAEAAVEEIRKKKEVQQREFQAIVENKSKVVEDLTLQLENLMDKYASVEVSSPSANLQFVKKFSPLLAAVAENIKNLRCEMDHSLSHCRRVLEEELLHCLQMGLHERQTHLQEIHRLRKQLLNNTIRAKCLKKDVLSHKKKIVACNDKVIGLNKSFHSLSSYSPRKKKIYTQNYQRQNYLFSRNHRFHLLQTKTSKLFIHRKPFRRSPSRSDP
eukprot:snap_masked-scaffold_35-processed-gene-0.15-mRNA-1 protein AED:0.36 eAED:0.36 QI:0/0/0/1/1/1/2/0/725